MTRVSKELMTVAGVVPKLQLGIKTPKGVVSTGKHKVKILSDRIVKGADINTGKDIEFVEYTLEENGEKKIYKTRVKNKNGELSYLVQHMAMIKEGDEIFIEMKKQGMKNYVSVTPVMGSVEQEVEDLEEIDL